MPDGWARSEREAAQAARRQRLAAARALLAVLPKPTRPTVDLPGTVKSYEATTGVALVQVDGDSGETWTGVKSLVGAVSTGDRVMVSFVPPRGIFLRTPPFA